MLKATNMSGFGVRANSGCVPVECDGSDCRNTPDSNTLLLIPSDGTDGCTTFTDISTAAGGITKFNQAQHSTDITAKFGATSMQFDGTDDYLKLDDGIAALGTGDFTIDFWLYPNTLGSDTGDVFIDTRTAPGSINPLVWYTGGNLNYYVNSGNRISDSSITTGAWQHVAIVRSSGTSRMYLDGTEVGSSYTDTHDLVASTAMWVGNIANAGAGFEIDAYIDEFRISDTARWTTGFTPPTAPY